VSLNGNQALDILASGSLVSKPVACTLTDTQGAEPTRAAGQSGLSYHSGADQYGNVWKTDRSWAGTCRQFSITSTDGTTPSALFELAR
jgi:hypothetical protein